MRTAFTSMLAGITLLIVSACTTAPPAREMPEIVSTANTSVDHLKLADLYAQKAANYAAEANMHNRMRQSYIGYSKGQGNSMAAHCTTLQSKLLESAQEARSLEKAHRELAASVSQ